MESRENDDSTKVYFNCPAKASLLNSKFQILKIG